jgi:hypothetical protein
VELFDVAPRGSTPIATGFTGPSTFSESSTLQELTPCGYRLTAPSTDLWMPAPLLALPNDLGTAVLVTANGAAAAGSASCTAQSFSFAGQTFMAAGAPSCSTAYLALLPPL